MPPVIDKDKCIRCGTCADICPLEVFGWKTEKTTIAVVETGENRPAQAVSGKSEDCKPGGAML